MRIFVYEFITGGGLIGQSLPQSLAQEGDLMLHALLEDLAQLPDIEMSVCRDARLPLPPLGGNIRVLPVSEESGMVECFNAEMRRADAVWPIAPETGALLENLCRRVQAAGKQLLTSPAEAVRIGGDKLRTYELLRQHAIPAVASCRLPGVLPAASSHWVVKARDGAGCADSMIVANNGAYQRVKATLNNPDNFILQPLTSGKPISLSCLFKHGEAALLSYNLQQIAICGAHFELHGCLVNAPCPDWELYRQFAQRVAQALPELWGYAGLDMLETPDGPLVMEINPRLTTSYAGLRQALQSNIAQRILDLPYAGLPPSIQLGRPVQVAIPKEKPHGG